MHEMSLAQEVVAVVSARLGDRRATAVRLQVGRLSCVVPEALALCFELAAQGTGLGGARLEIDEVEGRLWCRDCDTEQACPDLLLLCPCGSADVEVVAGQELQILSVDVAREPTCA